MRWQREHGHPQITSEISHRGGALVSAGAQTAVWNSDLDRASKYVLIAMADHADHLGENVRPSLSLIAWKTGYDERQVRRIVRQLEETGVLVRESDGTGGRAVATEYRIDFRALPKRPPYRSQKADKKSGYREEKADTTPPYAEPESRTFSTQYPDILNQYPDIAMSAEPIEPKEPRGAPKPQSRKAVKHPIPDDFAMTETTEAWCAKRNYSRQLVEQQVQAFVLSAKANGRKYSDWQAALRMWLTNCETRGWGQVKEKSRLSNVA